MRTPMRSLACLVSRVGSCCSALVALGCYGPSTTPAPAVERAHVLARPEPTIATLLGYEVVAPAGGSQLLARYCAGTDLELEAAATASDDETRCGTFWSRFEATLVAGLVPGGHVATVAVYPDPTTPDPWTRLSSRYPRNPIDVRSRRIFDRRFAFVRWHVDGATASRSRWAMENDDPQSPLPAAAQTEEELYEIHASGPQLLVKLPWSHPFDVSSGLAVAATRSNVTFLEVRSGPSKPGVKKEELRGFLTGGAARDKLFDVPLTDWHKPADATTAKLTVSRVTAAPGGLRITPYRVELTFAAAARDVVIERNSWTDARWAGVSPQPELVDAISIVKGAPFDESLETIE